MAIRYQAGPPRTTIHDIGEMVIGIRRAEYERQEALVQALAAFGVPLDWLMKRAHWEVDGAGIGRRSPRLVIRTGNEGDDAV